MTAVKRGRSGPAAAYAGPQLLGSVMLELKFMEPQSRWVIRALFRRNFDTFVDSAKVRINWAMLLWDLILLYLLLQLL
jgi:hypothetical protein